MIDNLSILLSHVLILIAFWRLTRRDDLDVEPPPPPDPEPQGFAAAMMNRRRRAPPADGAGQPPHA